MTYLAIGDLHYSDNVSPAFMKLVEDQIIDGADTHLPTTIVVLGDVLHRHSKIEFFAFKRAVAFLSRLRELPYVESLIIIIGNHDRPNNKAYDPDDHAFGALKSWPKTTVVDRPTIINAAVCIPYIPVDVPFATVLEPLIVTEDKTTSSRPLVVFCHQDFTGDYKDGQPYDVAWPKCVSGHIHDKRHVAHGKVFYPGSPYETHVAPLKACHNRSVSFLNARGEEVVSWPIKLPPRKVSVASAAEYEAYDGPTEFVESVRISDTRSSSNNNKGIMPLQSSTEAVSSSFMDRLLEIVSGNTNVMSVLGLKC